MFLRDRFNEFLAAATARLSRPGGERGISLAEVSGVLVVGGLIIAGALKGGALISIGQIRGGIAEVQKTQSVTATFQEQFQNLPGDFAEANAIIGAPIGLTWTISGDGDSLIDGTGVSAETVLFWNHLAAAGLINGVEIDPDPTAAGKLVFGVSLPSNPIGGGLTVVQDSLNSTQPHWIRLGTSDATAVGVVNADVALLIDKKIDDGRPSTGGVQVEDTQCISVVSAGAFPVYLTIVDDPSAVACLVNFELAS